MMHGARLAEVQTFVDLGHPGGAGTRELLADLYRSWQGAERT